MTYRLITYLTILMLTSSCGQPPRLFDLKEIAAELNELCPSMRDSETRWDNVVALPANILELTFTLVNIEKDNIDLILFENEIRIFLIGSLKNDHLSATINNMSIMESLRKNNVTFKYIFLDNKGEQITTLFIRPEEYKI